MGSRGRRIDGLHSRPFGATGYMLPVGQSPRARASRGGVGGGAARAEGRRAAAARAPERSGVPRAHRVAGSGMIGLFIIAWRGTVCGVRSNKVHALIHCRPATPRPDSATQHSVVDKEY